MTPAVVELSRGWLTIYSESPFAVEACRIESFGLTRHGFYIRTSTEKHWFTCDESTARATWEKLVRLITE